MKNMKNRYLDPDPDPRQNEMDPKRWNLLIPNFRYDPQARQMGKSEAVHATAVLPTRALVQKVIKKTTNPCEIIHLIHENCLSPFFFLLLKSVMPKNAYMSMCLRHLFLLALAY